MIDSLSQRESHQAQGEKIETASFIYLPTTRNELEVHCLVFRQLFYLLCDSSLAGSHTLFGLSCLLFQQGSIGFQVIGFGYLLVRQKFLDFLEFLVIRELCLVAFLTSLVKRLDLHAVGSLFTVVSCFLKVIKIKCMSFCSLRLAGLIFLCAAHC